MNVELLKKHLHRNNLSIRGLARMFDENMPNFNKKLRRGTITQNQIVQIVELLDLADWQEVFFPTLVIADTKRRQAREE